MLLRDETSGFRIRRDRPCSHEPLLEIQIASVRALSQGAYPPETIEAICALMAWEWWACPWRSSETFLAEEGGALVGFGQIDLAQASIEALFVRPEHAGRSIGRTLLETMEARAREAALASLALTSSVNASRFYERFGYGVEEEVELAVHEELRLKLLRMSKAL